MLAESQIQELFCSSVKFDHKLSISVLLKVVKVSADETELDLININALASDGMIEKPLQDKANTSKVIMILSE